MQIAIDSPSTIVSVALILLVPTISSSYFFLRLASRIDHLRGFFSLPGVLRAYLSSKGVGPQGRTERDLAQEFDRIFRTQANREYGSIRFLLAVVVGTISTGVVIYVLIEFGALGVLLGNHPLTGFVHPVEYALAGAFAWSLWLLLSGYESLDLTPSSFYWIPFRYVVAVIIGLLAAILFKAGGPAEAFAVAATAIPYPELINLLKTRILKTDGSPIIDKSILGIQGMHKRSIDTLNGVGINTTQELAYADPLMVLFRTNLPPKILIDWIDQALLYNYVGDCIDELRRRGIRGAIELYASGQKKELQRDLAKLLKITPDEFDNFTEMLGFDHQVQLVMQIWNEFEVD